MEFYSLFRYLTVVTCGTISLLLPWNIVFTVEFQNLPSHIADAGLSVGHRASVPFYSYYALCGECGHADAIVPGGAMLGGIHPACVSCFGERTIWRTAAFITVFHIFIPALAIAT
jgi:hypothetical protein